MANVRAGNSLYIDTQYAVAADELVASNLKVLYLLVTSTGANANLVLTDSGTSKINIRIAAANTSQVIDFSRRPLVFINSIRPTTLSNAVVTAVLDTTSA